MAVHRQGTLTSMHAHHSHPGHHERHAGGRTGWLRAAVLGANDGIVSTASLIVGVAAAQASHAQVTVAATAGLVAGALSMAAGEYISVHSQADAERADIDRERRELHHDYANERRELAGIYIRRGLAPALAHEVAVQLMAHDALGAHTRDELGITDLSRARPVQAAFASALSFAVGAALPLTVVWATSRTALLPTVAFTTLLFLAALGAAAAHVGGAPVLAGARRVALWGAAAMAGTAGVGAFVGA